MSDGNDDTPVDDPATSTSLKKMTITEIENSVIGLSPNLSHDQMLKFIMLATVLTQRSKQIKQRVEEAAIGWIKDHGPITCGPIVYSVGKSKSVKCTEVSKCFDFLLTACGGDVHAAVSYLVSNPFKHGSCRDLLSTDMWKSVFREDWQEKVVLKTTDTRFLTRVRDGSSD